MPEKKIKKIKLYKFASEYNLSSSSLMEFLQKKGYDVKSHMATLTDEMITDIRDKYKKDIQKAESHYKKVDEFNKKREERATDDKEKETGSDLKKESTLKEESLKEVSESVSTEKEELVAELNVPAEEETSEKEQPTEIEEKLEVKEKTESIKKQKAQSKTEIAQEENEEELDLEKSYRKEADSKSNASKNKETEENKKTKESKKTAKDKEPEEEIKAEEEIKVYEEKSKKGSSFKTKGELEIEKQKRDITVVGKIDLSSHKRKRKPKPGKKETEKTYEKASRKISPKTSNKKSEEASNKKRSETKPEVKISEGTKTSAEITDQSLKDKKKLKSRKQVDIEGFQEDAEKEKKSKKRKRKKRPEVDKKAVEDAIRRTMLGLDEGQASERAAFRKKKRKEKAEHEELVQEQRELEKSILKVTEYIAVSELANMMNVNVADVIAKCMGLGLMVSINQRLDIETITVVADEFGFEVEFEEEYAADAFEEDEDPEETLQFRPPVVTIMGHVDHGKTSLLDYIRKSNVVAGESGGITQHIGAYKVQVDDDKEIAFLDTPGHEAFTAMRARGASVTDIVILIVAADDAVMPQTVEAINHALAADVPIVVAINKIDKPGANSDKIKQQLADRKILVEDWGGKYQCVEISAKKGLNIDLLLEKLLLEAEMLDLKANPNRMAKGTVIESQLDKGRGITATILVQKGTLEIGDPFVAGVTHGRVRAMFDERNRKVEEAGPSTPVLVLGFEATPQAGDTFGVMQSERAARELSNKRMQLKNEQDRRQVKMMTLDEIARRASQGGLKELPLIVKGDVDGSVEALSDTLMKLSNDEVNVRVIHKGVGAISEGDVILAAASQAIIIGFHVRPHNNARKLAEKEQVDIRIYNIIYEAVTEVKSALEGLLEPVISEKLVATVEVRDTFKVPKVGTVAGCYVTDGKISRNNKIRLFREGIVIYEGELSQLKRFKDDVKEVDAGYECGLNISNFNDVKVGDIIESYTIVETKKTLS